MEILNNRRWSTWSSLFFIIPLIFSIKESNFILTILLLGTIIFSILHHLKKPSGINWLWDKKSNRLQYLLQWIDTIFGFTTFFYVFFNILQQGLTIFTLIKITLIFLAVFILFVPAKRYEAYHGLWHLMASIAILSFFV